MRTPTPFPAEFVLQLDTASAQLKTAEEHRRFLCVWLRVLRSMPASEIALIVKMHPRSVKRVQARFAEEGIAVLFDAGHGGRYHQYLTPQQEEDFLQPFLKTAEAGGLLTVMSIRNAYEKLVGHEVPKSTVYRLLARHGWRKITPRPRHPKTNVETQETFKKTLHS